MDIETLPPGTSVSGRVCAMVAVNPDEPNRLGGCEMTT